ncbi:hypothetical protein N7478_000459 [Penicillium angulare]|uniref:uncharacterized protein n=1 Tax=Penicillium angulare TaxID=116970 RepID=UPI00254034EE|nr:uncharacterized protein N7478_000459 [Penicillium angulare]KAJ5291208.1 hypothetical protein N7478_000459 [Penicillium angulare]
MLTTSFNRKLTTNIVPDLLRVAVHYTPKLETYDQDASGGASALKRSIIMSATIQTDLYRTLAPPEDQQPPRKKIRKGTRSCWECKHRKVRCHFVSDGDQSCRECLARGTTCQSQDLPEPNVHESDRASLGDRLGRVESLLERVLHRLDTIGSVEEARELPSTAAYDGFASSAAATPANENAPALSLFDNGLLGFRRSDVTTPSMTLCADMNRDLEKLSHELLSLLPSNTSLNRLEEANSCWWLVRAQCFQNYEESLLPSAVAARSHRHPTAVAKVLLWVGICLQQLPRGFDTHSLELPYSPTRLIAESVRVVARSITSDEILSSSIDGLECLVLQGVLYNNDGKLRSAWLSYRRAINVAQVIGLHRLPTESIGESNSVSGARVIWNHIIYADRYLSLMLGMYHGVPDVALDPERGVDQSISTSCMDLLCRIAGSIIERNQKFSSATPSMVRVTQTIDAELMSIYIEPVVGDSITSSPEKSTERAQAYMKLMTQLWHYQLIAWLHLPLLLDSGRRYDYSWQSCLDASRSIITCYTSIRRLTADSFCCKSLDFQAFTAAVTLLINILGPAGQSSLNSDDWLSIETVITTLEVLAEGEPPDKVASRGLAVLRFLKGVATGDSVARSDNSNGIPPIESHPGRIKVDIPYFGTISLDRTIRSDLPERWQYDANRSKSFTVDPIPNNENTSDVANVMEGSAVQDQANSVEPWLEGELGLGPTDVWSFHPELTSLPSFLPNLADDWDLAL